MVRFWHFVAHFNELSVIQVLRTQESAAPSLRYAHSLNTVASASTIPQICVWPPAATARVYNKIFVAFCCNFVAFCCQPACAEAEVFMHLINLTQSQIRICVFYSHVTCCLCNFVVFCGQLHSDSGESDFLHFFCSALAIITKSHL